MSGLQEILLIAAILAAIVFIPRMRAGRATVRPAGPAAGRLPGRLRLMVAASLVYPALAAAVLKPWTGEWVRFLYLGLGPVGLAWLLWWVVGGFRNR